MSKAQESQHHWKEVAIGSVADVEVGGTPSTAVPSFWGGNIPWMSSGEVNQYRISSVQGRITQSGLRSSNAKFINPPAVALALAGQGKTRGTVALTLISLCTNQSVALIKGHDGLLDTVFLFHALDARYDELRTRSAGGGRAGLSKSIIEAIPIALPELIEQQKIAEIFDVIDKAIALTNTHITKLKKAKAGLLHDLLTRGIDDHGELRDYTRNPELFKRSPLGIIPKDWDVLSVEEILEGRPKNGYSPKEANEWTGKLMLGLGCLTPNGFQPCQLKNAPANDLKTNAALLRDGDFLISRSNTRELVGLVGVYKDIGIPTIYPDLMMRLTPNNRITVHFLELLMKHEPVRRQLTGTAQGTSGSMVKINSKSVLSTVTVVPQPEEQQRILQAIDESVNHVNLKNYYLEKLKLLKQGLMSDLLTGRVRVKI
ncbi:MAG: restriction endonuclease subunit S [Nostoc sp.]|uniref:restriction endonuclease subunit S n=1 Tax=Nostoc sp. TaxID=1180 RepID=UPI002FF713ED